MTDSLDSLQPDPQNARSHDERNLELIVTSLRDVGAARSIVVDENGTILAGNATVAAARAAGLRNVQVVEADGKTVIAVRRSGLTPEQKQRLALYDNRAAELAEWDHAVLATLVDEIDLSAMWSEDELADLLAQDEAGIDLIGDPDAVPEVPDDPVTQSGDLWVLGSHRLLCGDAAKPDDLAQLMGGEHAACLWTDPPYGVAYVGKTAEALTIANDDDAGLQGLLRAAFAAVTPHLVAGASFYIAHPAGPLASVFAAAVTDAGWSLRQTLVWVKDHFVLGRSDYHYRHEPILFGYVPGEGRRGRGGSGWFGDNAQDSVFEVPRPTASPDHPTCKPVELIAAMLHNSTRRGDIVLDPFGGSGSTLIAGEQLGRPTRLMELDPKYCDVIVRRWEAVTGTSATRITD
jgi:site-specific DNA-methyltransferase (adenine-specific)